MTKSVFIAIPCGSSQIYWTTCHSLINLTAQLVEEGWDYSIAFLPGSSLVDQARNLLLKSFLDSKCDNLLWIDADVGFEASDAMKLLESPEKIVGGVYPIKRMDEAYPIKLIEPLNRKGEMVEAYYLPGGFTRFKRSCIQDIIERYGEQTLCTYKMGGGEELKVHHIYQCGVSDEGGYSGEDVSICNVLRTMGYRVWAFPDMTLTHTGTYTWTGNMAKHMEAKDA